METAIQTVYASLRRAMRGHATAAERTITAKGKLDRAKLTGLADGTIDGKNADLREARAREVLAAQYDELESAETAERSARLSLDLARCEVEELRAYIRVGEVNAATVTASGWPGAEDIKAL